MFGTRQMLYVLCQSTEMSPQLAGFEVLAVAVMKNSIWDY
jgi:hypothetical protein